MTNHTKSDYQQVIDVYCDKLREMKLEFGEHSIDHICQILKASVDHEYPETQLNYNRERPRRAPWPDYIGNPIYDGDTIFHQSSGEIGTVKYANGFEAGRARAGNNYGWYVDYDGKPYSALQLQVGDKGQATVVRNSQDHHSQPTPAPTADTVRRYCQTLHGIQTPRINNSVCG